MLDLVTHELILKSLQCIDLPNVILKYMPIRWCIFHWDYFRFILSGILLTWTWTPQHRPQTHLHTFSAWMTLDYLTMQNLIWEHSLLLSSFFRGTLTCPSDSTNTTTFILNLVAMTWRRLSNATSGKVIVVESQAYTYLGMQVGDKLLNVDENDTLSASYKSSLKSDQRQSYKHIRCIYYFSIVDWTRKGHDRQTSELTILVSL